MLAVLVGAALLGQSTVKVTGHGMKVTGRKVKVTCQKVIIKNLEYQECPPRSTGECGYEQLLGDLICGGSLTSGQLFRAISRLPQCKGFQLLSVFFLSCYNTEIEATPQTWRYQVPSFLI